MTGRWRTAALAGTLAAGLAGLAPLGGGTQGAGRALAWVAGGPLEAQVRPQPPQRRALERRFQQRFLDMSRERLDLGDRQTERLGQILERGWQARQALQRELTAERERFFEAIRDPDTTDEEFLRRLTAMEDLRRREYELWRSEQRALAEFMNPRQRAMFVQMQMRMNEALRDRRRHGDDGPKREGDRRDDGGGGPNERGPNGPIPDRGPRGDGALHSGGAPRP